MRRIIFLILLLVGFINQQHYSNDLLYEEYEWNFENKSQILEICDLVQQHPSVKEKKEDRKKLEDAIEERKNSQIEEDAQIEENWIWDIKKHASHTFKGWLFFFLHLDEILTIVTVLSASVILFFLYPFLLEAYRSQYPPKPTSTFSTSELRPQKIGTTQKGVLKFDFDKKVDIELIVPDSFKMVGVPKKMKNINGPINIPFSYQPKSTKREKIKIEIKDNNPKKSWKKKFFGKDLVWLEGSDATETKELDLAFVEPIEWRFSNPITNFDLLKVKVVLEVVDEEETGDFNQLLRKGIKIQLNESDSNMVKFPKVKQIEKNTIELDFSTAVFNREKPPKIILKVTDFGGQNHSTKIDCKALKEQEEALSSLQNLQNQFNEQCEDTSDWPKIQNLQQTVERIQKLIERLHNSATNKKKSWGKKQLENKKTLKKEERKHFQKNLQSLRNSSLKKMSNLYTSSYKKIKESSLSPNEKNAHQERLKKAFTESHLEKLAKSLQALNVAIKKKKYPAKERFEEVKTFINQKKTDETEYEQKLQQTEDLSKMSVALKHFLGTYTSIYEQFSALKTNKKTLKKEKLNQLINLEKTLENLEKEIKEGLPNEERERLNKLKKAINNSKNQAQQQKKQWEEEVLPVEQAEKSWNELLKKSEAHGEVLLGKTFGKNYTANAFELVLTDFQKELKAQKMISGKKALLAKIFTVFEALFKHNQTITKYDLDWTNNPSSLYLYLFFKKGLANKNDLLDSGYILEFQSYEKKSLEQQKQLVENVLVFLENEMVRELQLQTKQRIRNEKLYAWQKLDDVAKSLKKAFELTKLQEEKYNALPISFYTDLSHQLKKETPFLDLVKSPTKEKGAFFKRIIPFFTSYVLNMRVEKKTILGWLFENYKKQYNEIVFIRGNLNLIAINALLKESEKRKIENEKKMEEITKKLQELKRKELVASADIKDYSSQIKKHPQKMSGLKHALNLCSKMMAENKIAREQQQKTIDDLEKKEKVLREKKETTELNYKAAEKLITETLAKLEQKKNNLPEGDEKTEYEKLIETNKKTLKKEERKERDLYSDSLEQVFDHMRKLTRQNKNLKKLRMERLELVSRYHSLRKQEETLNKQLVTHHNLLKKSEKDYNQIIADTDLLVLKKDKQIKTSYNDSVTYKNRSKTKENLLKNIEIKKTMNLWKKEYIEPLVAALDSVEGAIQLEEQLELIKREYDQEKKKENDTSQNRLKSFDNQLIEKQSELKKKWSLQDTKYNFDFQAQLKENRGLMQSVWGIGDWNYWKSEKYKKTEFNQDLQLKHIKMMREKMTEDTLKSFNSRKESEKKRHTNHLNQIETSYLSAKLRIENKLKKLKQNPLCQMEKIDQTIYANFLTSSDEVLAQKLFKNGCLNPKKI